MADSSTRWADCSSSGEEEDDEGFFDRSDLNYRPKPAREDSSAAAARTKNFPSGKEDHLKRLQQHESDLVGKKPNQYRQHYNTKQQQCRNIGSRGTTNVSRPSYIGSSKGDDEALDWKILARKSSKILQNDKSSSLLTAQQRSSSGSGQLKSDSMEVAATSWIEKRQMKEQKRMQEEVNKAEQASKILEEEKRLRLKQQTAGLKAALTSLQRERMAEPSTAATNALVLDEAAQQSSSASTPHPTRHDEKKIILKETEVVMDQSAKPEEKTRYLREQKLQQTDQQQALINHNQNKQPQQTQQQQAYPTKILSKPRQELDSLLESLESCAVENSCSSSELPNATTTNPAVTISRMDRSAPLKDNGLDTKNHQMKSQSSVQVMIMSEHKNLSNKDNESSKPGYSQEYEHAGGSNQVKNVSTTDHYKDKEELRKDRLKEDKVEAHISLKDEAKASSVNEPFINNTDDLKDKDDHDHSFSLVSSRKPRSTKRIVKHSSVKEKGRIQSFKKGYVSTEKSIDKPMEEEHDVTVRIVMPDGREIKQQASTGRKNKNQSSSAAIMTTSVSPHSKQSKYMGNEKTVERKATSDVVKCFPKPGLSKNHGQEQTADKKQLDANLGQTERVQVVMFHQGSRPTKKHVKEPKIKRGNLQKMPQDEQKKVESSLPRHADTDDRKCIQDVAEPKGEADLNIEVNHLKANSSGLAEDAAKVSSPQQSILENSTEEVEITKRSSPAHYVSTTLHPSGKSVSFNRNKIGTKPRRGGASFQYRDRPPTGGRRVASTAAIEPTISSQSSSVIEKVRTDIPQSVSDVSSSKLLGGGLSNSGSIVNPVEKIERDQVVETIKESFIGDGGRTQNSVPKFNKSRDRRSIITSGQSKRGRGRSATPRTGRTPS